MPATMKLTRQSERRLLELISGGATIMEAARAVQVSRTTVYRHAEQDPIFGAQLREARNRSIATVTPLPKDPAWMKSARLLEQQWEMWRLPGG